MEYDGPGHGYDTAPEPTTSEKFDNFFEKAYPIIMPIIILAIGVCAAIAVKS